MASKKILNAAVSPASGRATGSGFITVGLLSVPFKAYKPTDDFTPGFKQVHGACGSPIKQSLVCPKCDVAVARDALRKGIEVGKGDVIPFDESELADVKADADVAYNVDNFVTVADTARYIRSGDFRYIGADPEQPCEAYRVLFTAIAKSGKVGLVDYVARGFNHRAILEADTKRGIFCLYDVLYADQIRDAKGIPRPRDLTATDEEMDLANQLIESMTAPAEAIGNSPNQERLEAFKARKIAEAAGNTATTEAPAPKAHKAPIDLMAALKASLAKKAAAAATTTEKVAA